MLSLHPLSSDLNIRNMATKFVVAVAMFALCHANPVLINGILYRDGRAYSMGQASSFGGGVSTAHANVNGDAAHAFGSANNGAAGLARDGYYYPGQAIAQAQTYDAPPFPQSAYGSAKAVAQAQDGAYYPVPAPATVITYEQNFAPAASSASHADSHGDGVAQSSAKTQGFGGYSATSSNAHSHGLGSADSNANSGLSGISSFAKTQGEGSAASSAQNNGVVGVVYPAPAAPAVLADQPAPAVIDAKSPIYYTAYVPAGPAPGVASSSANVVGAGHAASSAKVGHGQGRTIAWRFGTMYDAPASALAQANTQAGYGAAKSAAHTHGYGAANANADVHGYGSAKSVADSHSAGHGVAQSAANSHGAGSANANANVNSAGYSGARSSADVHGQYYGGSRTSADAHSHGFGNAASSARSQGLNTAFKVTDSRASSHGSGSAHANAVSV